MQRERSEWEAQNAISPVTGKAEGENFCPGTARREKSSFFLSFPKGWWWFRQHSKECMQTNGVRVRTGVAVSGDNGRGKGWKWHFASLAEETFTHTHTLTHTQTHTYVSMRTRTHVPGPAKKTYTHTHTCARARGGTPKSLLWRGLFGRQVTGGASFSRVSVWRWPWRASGLPS